MPMQVRWSILFILCLLLCSLGCLPACAWGPAAHTLITQHAIQLTPREMKPFYETNSRYIVALTMLPDDWRHTHKEGGPDHYIDMDQLDEPPFAKLRGDRATIEQRFGKEKVLDAGLLPWAIQERYGKLVEAFRAKDTVRIAVQSALLAHFVGDAHVPFHVTKDYDGRKPEQKGLHFRWEENLAALWLKPESLHPVKPQKIDDVLQSAFDWCTASYGYIDTICEADDKASDKDPARTFSYYKILWQETGGILRGRLSAASEALAGVWIAAWEEAAKPELQDKAAPLFWGE